MIHDFRFAFRQLIKAPGFTIAAVLVLALGIGANTAVFSLVNTLFFAPPAYAKPHEMLQIFSQDKKDPKKFRGFSYPTYRDIREQNTVFSDAMAFNLALIGLGQKGDTRRTFAAVVSSNYFSVLGVPLARGRAFLPEEETPGRNAPVAIVSYSYWQKHDLDPTVLGSQVLINGRPFTSSESHRRVSPARCRFCHRKFGCRSAFTIRSPTILGRRTRPRWTIAAVRSCAL